jgi:stage V sporulation protein AD
MKLTGKTITFTNPIYVKSWASAVGSKETAGPLKNHFDLTFDDDLLGQPTWEKAETQLVRSAVKTALDKGGVTLPQLDFMTGGDLLNQCTASSFASRDFSVPFLGLYGACSTMAEGLLISSVFIDGGMKYALCEASSHFCSAERQYRMPIEYGSQRSPAAQWTVTGCGAVLVSDEPSEIMITRAKIGKIVDLGVTDISNMGAAMAPAAFDTINEFFKETGTSPSDFDLIVTGDLAQVGHDVVVELFDRENVDISPYYDDCGCMIFDGQDTHAGGSGCGCSASVLCSILLKRMKEGEINSLLFCGTGALLSPTTSNQGESIPGICHLVELRRV